MSRHLIGLLALALTLVPATSRAAATPGVAAVYDTIDAVEVAGDKITITGIIVGQSSPTERFYFIFDPSAGNATGGAARCDRLALLVVAKPGKYRLEMTQVSSTDFGCKLIVRAP